MMRAGSRPLRITTTASGLACSKYGSTKSSRRPFGASTIGMLRPALGANVRAHVPLLSILRPYLPQSAPLAGQSPARERCQIQATRQRLPDMRGTRSPASARQLAHSSRSGDLRSKVAGAPHTLFHRKRARRGWLPTPTVLLAGRILRQPRLPPSLGPGQARRASARRQSNHRTAEEDHGDLWPQDHQALSGQATNRDRGHEPTQPGDPQPLRKRLYQAIRSWITSSSAQNLQATTSTTMASRKRWKISLSCARPYRRSTTTISTCSRIFWRPLSIVASHESLRNRRSRLPESAFRASSSITLGNSP